MNTAVETAGSTLLNTTSGLTLSIRDQLAIGCLAFIIGCLFLSILIEAVHNKRLEEEAEAEGRPGTRSQDTEMRMKEVSVLQPSGSAESLNV